LRTHAEAEEGAALDVEHRHDVEARLNRDHKVPSFGGVGRAAVNATGEVEVRDEADGHHIENQRAAETKTSAEFRAGDVTGHFSETETGLDAKTRHQLRLSGTAERSRDESACEQPFFRNHHEFVFSPLSLKLGSQSFFEKAIEREKTG